MQNAQAAVAQPEPRPVLGQTDGLNGEESSDDENEDGDEAITWETQTEYRLSFPFLHPISTNIIQLENYKKKFKEIMDGKWGKKYLIDILSRNN